ncbi:MAG: 2-hydroxyacid dehydrogenase [Myxococcota bacterium]
MRVLVTQDIDPVGLALLAHHDVSVWSGPPIPRAQLLARVRGCDGLLAMPTDRIDGEVLDAGPVRVVANHAVGLDNVDLAAARARGVIVTNTPGVLTDATADLTLALLLACARHVLEGDRLVRAGAWDGWRPLQLRGLELRGATLVIVGMGRIGRAVAARAEAFGMRVVGVGRADDLDAALAIADVVSVHCPLTPETRGLLGAARLARLRPGAIVLNTARGPIVDEEALAEALHAGRLVAGIDVYAREPLVPDRLREAPGCVLLPHLGSATVHARREMARKAATNLVAALAGEPPPDRVA